MKALLTFFLGVWAFLGTIIAPAVLFMLFLCMTGLIYKYDGTMDEGTAHKKEKIYLRLSR
ncbi:MAG: hypothetical protein IJ207_14665 [Treponema sp.]|uniref:hypothetical protein n=1 Tax=Treponema sp. TaxID=166 RepID=UPI0025CCC692|nr:hypothetical protein [Treponema sp.]MBQ9283417.1 hypothetical protein [Treponema sp.]